MRRNTLGAGGVDSRPKMKGFKPWHPHMIFPLVPMKRLPPLSSRPINSPGFNSSGRGGSRPPSHQVIFTSGIFTFLYFSRAGKVYCTTSETGAQSKLNLEELPCNLVGYFKRRALNGGSKMWQAISPSAPVPKSHHPRQFQG